MEIVIAIVSTIIVVVLLVWLGLRIQPKPFPAFTQNPPGLKTVPLPDGLPAPVERYFRKVNGDNIPVIETIVLAGRGVVRPFMNIPLPARYMMVHNAGMDYRHYFEVTFFGRPFLKINEGYLDGKSFFESPMGTYYDDPNTNQGANLAVWAEGAWFPSIWITDPRVHWEPVDENTALLFVPFEEGQDTFVMRFNHQTGLLDMMEAMRYKNIADKHKILWITTSTKAKNGSTVALVMWLDEGRPWAALTLDSMVFNADIKQYIRHRGP
jgi:hypothetical protein